jgi:hypothetical protein
MAERARDPKIRLGQAMVGARRGDQMRPRKAAISERRTQPLHIILAADELAAVEQFRYLARMPSRAAAVRELLRRGLARASRSGDARPMRRARNWKY